ncbi:MAG TPA: Hsp20/alpha crystallin family protein [Thermoplasmata archaeon]|nr:Hsp20/alpha crystallin family protein [Thermoplasmata archaeon]
MMRKNKGDTKTDTGLARPTTGAPLAWFDDMDRWFDDIRRSFEHHFWGPLARGSESELAVRQPLVDLIDNGSDFVVRAELLGVAKGDVDLNVTPNGIEIRAEADRSREENEKDYFFQERTYGVLQRTLTFPEEVKSDLAKATLKDGVLEVRVPKKEPTPQTQPVKVRVE